MNYYYESPFGGKDLFEIYNKLNQIDSNFVANILQHERPEQELVAKYIPNNSIVLELGGNIGATATIINSKLIEKSNHIIIEPELNFVQSLLAIKNKFNLGFQQVHGILSKNKQEQIKLWPSCINSKQYSLNELETLLGGKKFTAILADCEGAFDPILQDFPELLETVKVIILENDGGDIKRVKKTLEENNFILVHSQIHPYWNGDLSSFKDLIGFHEVWIKNTY